MPASSLSVSPHFIPWHPGILHWSPSFACAEERPCIIWGNGSSWGSRNVLLIVPNVIVYDYTSFGVFPCGSVGKESACNEGDLGSISTLGRSPGEGKGYPLQCSGLENSMDCIVHGVPKSQTRLTDFTHKHRMFTWKMKHNTVHIDWI